MAFGPVLVSRATMNRLFWYFVSEDMSSQRHLPIMRPPELESTKCSVGVAGNVMNNNTFCNNQFRAMTSKYGEKRHRLVEVHILVHKNHPHMDLSTRPQQEKQTWATLPYSISLPNLVFSN
ncbi:hypothetical protein Y032_0014g2321 [Ancylostoma ceylanicum]|uniref:Uncharacterized protein n=1 Tax=Ancylostoma ceylanicum TaxID=53326 RepID=A0A016V8Y8_9BILA|nr:hypothetical protein Y032_0014g2321 [Ancylostoma ceylanicum]